MGTQVPTESRRSQILRAISPVLFCGSPVCHLEATLNCSGWAWDWPCLPQGSSSRKSRAVVLTHFLLSAHSRISLSGLVQRHQVE